ncbi:hypothetical protein V8E52_006886 [Russula decolorans]
MVHAGGTHFDASKHVSTAPNPLPTNAIPDPKAEPPPMPLPPPMLPLPTPLHPPAPLHALMS